MLLDHPAVAQAWRSRMPHDKLGEEVAAAVVLREGASATERELRDFAAERLADSRCRGRSCSSTRSRRARPASCSASGWRERLGAGGMRIVHLRRGRDRRLLGGRARARRQDVTLIARGAHLAAMRAHGLTLLGGEERRVTSPRAPTIPPRRAAGLSWSCAQGALGRRPRATARAAARARHGGRDGAERHALVVLHGIAGRWRTTASSSVDPAAASGTRSGRSASSAASSTQPARSSRRRHPPHRGRPLQPGRARRHAIGARPALGQALTTAGLKAPVPTAHPRRDLGQALGQRCRSTRSAR